MWLTRISAVAVTADRTVYWQTIKPVLVISFSLFCCGRSAFHSLAVPPSQCFAMFNSMNTNTHQIMLLVLVQFRRVHETRMLLLRQCINSNRPSAYKAPIQGWFQRHWVQRLIYRHTPRLFCSRSTLASSAYIHVHHLGTSERIPGTAEHKREGPVRDFVPPASKLWIEVYEYKTRKSAIAERQPIVRRCLE